MKFLKGLALSLLSLLLFLSLSILGLVFMLNNTILNPDFVVSEVNSLDITSLAKDALSEQIPQEMESMSDVINDTLTDLEPWIKDQLDTAIHSSYDYLKGESQSLSLVISLESVKEKLRDNLWQTFLESPPPELAGIPPAEVEQYFNEFYQQFSQQIPSTFEFNESMISPEIMTQIQQARQYIGYLQLGYKGLIGFILLLILLIVLIHHQVRGATRGIGTIFLTYGAIEYGGILAAKHLAATQLPQLEILPTALQAWVPQFLNNLLAPLEMFSLGVLIGGVVLLIVSFVYKPRQPLT